MTVYQITPQSVAKAVMIVTTVIHAFHAPLRALGRRGP
jgi:hypothetical protein